MTKLDFSTVKIHLPKEDHGLTRSTAGFEAGWGCGLVLRTASLIWLIFSLCLRCPVPVLSSLPLQAALWKLGVDSVTSCGHSYTWNKWNCRIGSHWGCISTCLWKFQNLQNLECQLCFLTGVPGLCFSLPSRHSFPFSVHYVCLRSVFLSLE